MLTRTTLTCCVLLALLIVQTIIFWRQSAGNVPLLSPVQPAIQTAASSPVASSFDEWHFVTARDANNIALSSAQCDAAFPDLYFEIDRSVKLWTDRRHRISSQDTSIAWRRDAAFRLLIHDNWIRILETRDIMNSAYRQRTLSVLHQLHKAVLGATIAGETLPTIEFAVTVDDMSLIPNAENDTHAIWAFTRRLIDTDQDRTWLIPDFNFWSGPGPDGGFYEVQRRAHRHNAFMLDKIPKAVWRGVVWTNQALRDALVQITKGKAWADVAETVWETKTNLMSLEDLCQYAFVIHTEGRSWSGRLKYLLNCDSLPIVHELDWTTHYYHLLEPNGTMQNYVPVHRNWSDLETKVEYYLAHPFEAQVIADQAVATFRDRYLTAAAEACYWRRLIQGYSKVAEEPETFEPESGDGAGAEMLRGISFEDFVLQNDEWPSTLHDGG